MGDNRAQCCRFCASMWEINSIGFYWCIVGLVTILRLGIILDQTNSFVYFHKFSS